MDDREGEGDAASSDHHDDGGIGSVYRMTWSTVRPFDHHGHRFSDIDAIRNARFDIPTLLGHIVQFSSPPSRFFANQDQAFLADGATLFTGYNGRAGDGEWVGFGPA